MNLAALLLALVAWLDDPGPIQPSDYEAMWQALQRPASSEPGRVVSFHDLWSQPDAWRGIRVCVEGRVERRFRQSPVGRFPALTETWLFTEDRNPLCVVSPGSANEARIGDPVAFSGCFLRLVTYHAADGDRLAPCIVGPDPPQRREAAPNVNPTEFRRWDWVVGITLAVFVVGILGAQHLRRPVSRTRAGGPSPRFVSEDAEQPYNSPDDAGDTPIEPRSE